MALTDTAIRALKPRARQYKVSDANGLYLLVLPSGGRLWRLKYRIAGKEKALPLGKYPDVGLREARELRDTARKRIAAGVDPAREKRAAKVAASIAAANTFRSVADEFITKCQTEGHRESTVVKAQWFLELLAPVANQPVSEIQPSELLDALRRVERRGNLETAMRMRSFASRVFRYAVATARADADPAALLKGALTSPRVRHHAAITEPKKVGELLRAIDGFEGQPSTRLALRLMPHVFTRPGELRHAEWTEFDLDAAIWRIPARRMKMGREHVVPLSSQAVSILREAHRLSGTGALAFPGVRVINRPMSENTLNAALRRLGYSKDEMTSHGFRAMASTLLNESGRWSPDAIERALAHEDSDKIRGAYHRGAHWNERVEMAQWWSDYLDTLRNGAEVIRFIKAG